MLITIHRTFIRPHLDYGDVLYESIQYNACLALTGAIRGTSEEKIYQELGLESLRDRRWCRKLCLFYKVLENENPKYLFSLILPPGAHYTQLKIYIISPLLTQNTTFSKTPSTIIEWNNLDLHLRKSESFSVFQT